MLNSEAIARILRRAVLDCVADCGEVRGQILEAEELFRSPAVEAIKDEMVRAGRKLWERQYVDGNGGNLSARVSERFVLATPTMCSKGDLTANDLSLVDLDGRQYCGEMPRTSEILLHLEIYKAVPRAKAVIHAHPPYVTAHAIAGVLPQGNLLPEQEVFIGPMALAPYETPGSPAFARTILPAARRHNTVLLRNHGVVSWADTVTHAEWCIEVAETYCKTAMIAREIRSPLEEISPEKVSELLACKHRLGLLDARDPDEMWEKQEGEAAAQNRPMSEVSSLDEMDALVGSLTEQVLEFLQRTQV